MTMGVMLLMLAVSGDLEKLTRSVAESGRVVELVRLPPDRIAPGAPPLVSFRYLDGARRHRFGNLDLVLDDASH